MKKAFEEYLNEVSYNFEVYTPSEAALKFASFIAMVNDGQPENKTPIVHLKVFDSIFDKSKNSANVLFRGAAKTSMLEYLILYIGAFGEMPNGVKLDFAIYIGDSIENGVKSFRKNLEHRYNNSTFLQQMIPQGNIKYTEEGATPGARFTDVRIEFVNNRGNRFALRLYGVLTGIRGAKEYGKRPQLALIDDILSDEDARSETVIKSINDTIHKAVRYALDPKKNKMIWVGTPFNSRDPLYTVVESGAWNVSMFPICEKFPCERSEFKGAWEDRFDYDFVKSAYDNALALGQIDSFNQELMLRIISSEDTLVPMESIVYFNRTELMKAKGEYNFYITTDLATSTKKSADYSVISVWAYNHNGDYMLVDGWCKRADVSEFVNQLFVYASFYDPLGVGIEVTGQQGGFISWIRDEMLKRKVYFNFLSSNNGSEDGIRPVKDKFERFLMFKPRFVAKKIWIANELKESDWYKEFVEEISKATTKGFKSKHDDVLDTISMLGSFEAYKPSGGSSYDKYSEIPQIRNTIF